jgi:amino acid permease
MDFFKNLGIAFYGYVNQFAIVKIFKEIRNANRVGFASITLRSGYPPMLLYTLVLFAGYISFGEDIPEFIVLRPSLVGSSDIFMTIGQFGILLTMLLGLIIRVQSNRNIIQYFLKTAGCIQKKPGDKISKKANVTITSLLTFIPGVIAILIQTNISNYVSLFSSLVCPYYILIAPCKCLDLI